MLDEELTQIRELLMGIARRGSQSFTLWIQGVETAEMAQRERILTKLSNAGLVMLEWRYTDHNAYVRASITDKGVKLTNTLLNTPG